MLRYDMLPYASYPSPVAKTNIRNKQSEKHQDPAMFSETNKQISRDDVADMMWFTYTENRADQPTRFRAYYW